MIFIDRPTRGPPRFSLHFAWTCVLHAATWCSFFGVTVACTRTPVHRWCSGEVVRLDREPFLHTPEYRPDDPTLAKAHTHLGLSALESHFSRAEGWGFRGFCFPDADHQQIVVEITHARHGDKEMLTARTTALAGDIDILVAFRVADSENERRERSGDLVIFEVQGTQLMCLASSDLPPTATPSVAALDQELLDDYRLFGMGSSHWWSPPRPPYVRKEIWAEYSHQRIDVAQRGHDENGLALGIRTGCAVSWNGPSSTDIVGVSRPDYYGFAEIDTAMDEATCARTRGKLPEWAEPVWGVSAWLVTPK